MMQKNCVKEKQSYCSRYLLSTLFVISFLLLCSDISFAASKYYYYLQVGSFRIKKEAIEFIAQIEKHNYKGVAKSEKIADQGQWYIVYIGPLSSREEANLTLRSLRKKKLAKYIAVHQKKSLVSSNLMTGKKVVDEKTTKAEKPSAHVSFTKMKQMPQRGIGRNMAVKNFALGYRHLYREIATEVTKRKQITSAGSSTVVISDSEKDDFPTSMHIDSIYARYGLTNFLEIFLEGGVGYKETSSTSFVYGGGLQLSLFEVINGVFKGLYGNLTGSYLSGDVEYEYRSPARNKWNKEAEFDEVSLKGEIGVISSRFAVYFGAVFLDYNETTKRKNLTGSSLVYEDEVENETSVGGYAGAEIYLTPSAVIKISGQVIKKENIFIAFEYHF
ncbi:MAG: SPOR domain-containing protein [Deltaproteobacteria bacterium]|nr:SPOR domain-containing protein [Deltaproteobacteria bacterium]